MSRNEREDELWRKWRNREPLGNAGMEEALALEVGLFGRPPAEDDPRYPDFLWLWSKCARFETNRLTREEHEEAVGFGISIPYPLPTEAEIERYERQRPLVAKRFKGEPWTSLECEAAVELGLHTREEADAFVNVTATLHARGYRPWYRGGIECEGVLIDGFPRAADGGYEIPALLTDVQYRGRGMNFVDPTGEQGRHYVRWIGRHRWTGKLVARTDSPYDIVPALKLSWWEKATRQLFGEPFSAELPAFQDVDGATVADPSSILSPFDTPEYACVWLE